MNAILDEALFCHVAVVHDGSPRVIPTIHARVDDTLYLHGSTASRTLRSAIAGDTEVCVAVTLIDGLVLARSAFHHSMNYRSVLVYGRVREVTDPDEKWRAQLALVDHVVPGRADQVRQPDERELKQTSIVALSLEEASAKIRTGHPVDDAADADFPVWAGVLPLTLEPGSPIPDPQLLEGLELPENVHNYRRPR